MTNMWGWSHEISITSTYLSKKPQMIFVVLIHCHLNVFNVPFVFSGDEELKLFIYFPGTISKFVSGLTHLTLHSSEEVNTCSVSNPRDKSAAKQRSSEIKFQCLFLL